MDPTTIGQQLKAKYPQYAQYPDAVVGQRWLEVYHKPAAGAGAGINPNSYLTQPQAPQLSTQPKSSKPNGAAFEKSYTAPPVNLSGTVKAGGLAPGLAGTTVNAPATSGGGTPWIGSQIADMFRVPQFNPADPSKMGF